MATQDNSSPPHSVEISPVDISVYRAGNTGVEFVTTFDSGRPGAHVMVMAITHGNEICGAIVLDELLQSDIRPSNGKLTLGFHNTAAYETFDPAFPTASRFVDEDLNRVWDASVLDGERDTVETRRAREMRPIIDTVDLLLDIHSMQTSCPALTLSGPLQKGRELAMSMRLPAYVVSDEGHAAGRRLRDYGPFGDPGQTNNALLLEAGQHWEAATVHVARDVTWRFLNLSGVVSDETFLEHSSFTDKGPSQMIEVTAPYTIETDEFEWLDEYFGMEIIESAGTTLAVDGDKEVKTPYDNCVLIMPNRRRVRGQSAVRFGRVVS